MYKIEINGNTANINLDEAKDLYFQVNDFSPSKAVTNLIFHLESEFHRLEQVSYEDLTPDAQEKMEILEKFIKGQKK